MAYVTMCPVLEAEGAGCSKRGTEHNQSKWKQGSGRLIHGGREKESWQHKLLGEGWEEDGRAGGLHVHGKGQGKGGRMRMHKEAQYRAGAGRAASSRRWLGRVVF